MSPRFIIRPSESVDLPFLFDMLWEAAAVDSGMRRLGKEAALAHQNNSKYLEDWGRSGDGGVIAIDASGQPAGAAWYRLFPADAPGYGFVAAGIPELSIGVSGQARGKGIGGALLDALTEFAKAEGFRALSLSVDRQNPAVALYERHGFRDAGISGPEETGVTMIATLE